MNAPACRVITAAITGRLAGFVLCLSGDEGRDPGVATGGLSLTAEQSHAFTESGLRVRALVVAPVARHVDVVQQLLDEARLDQPDGRIVLVLPGQHPVVRVARASGWHEAVRGGSGVQLLLGPDHPALSALLLHA